VEAIVRSLVRCKLLVISHHSSPAIGPENSPTTPQEPALSCQHSVLGSVPGPTNSWQKSCSWQNSPTTPQEPALSSSGSHFAVMEGAWGGGGGGGADTDEAGAALAAAAAPASAAAAAGSSDDEGEARMLPKSQN
jgi:hypothetical protein